ncbi:hypothetical protein [Candidatus Nephthysia bennettiae]|uniref:Cyclic nucleotide-binding domain-containing protein n=1 Tax=Candidatus Nephthysia bennettiae TaxID=3127016 RepID=A0A934K124_9BACT|nr:hypothetical protein [Candidatus Dormibacteraeota bacterium]
MRQATIRVVLADDSLIVRQGVRALIELAPDLEVIGEASDYDLAEIGPGAVIGERAHQEGGIRTATLRALTRCRVARSHPGRLQPERLAELAAHHRQEVRAVEGLPC